MARKQKTKQITKQKQKTEEEKPKTVKTVAKKLLVIFKKHIGEENRINRNDLFYEVYGVSIHEISELKAWFMWDIIRKAMHYCRKHTKCMVISTRYSDEHYLNDNSRYYFVASNMYEADIYCNILTKSQNAMTSAKKRMKRAVRNNYHKYPSDWKVD